MSGRGRISERAAEFRARFAQDPLGSPDARARDAVSFDRSGPWLSTRTIAAHYDFPSRKAVRDWCRRNGIAAVRQGRRVLYAARDVEASLRRIG